MSEIRNQKSEVGNQRSEKMQINSAKDLKVYKKAYELAMEILKIIFPFSTCLSFVVKGDGIRFLSLIKTINDLLTDCHSRPPVDGLLRNDSGEVAVITETRLNTELVIKHSKFTFI